MAPIKVIGAGLGRTGTESLMIALNILGYKAHHMKSFFTDPTLDGDGFYHAYKYRDEADWDKIYANYDAAVDFSAATFYLGLFKKYPDAKVLLTVRSADSWYNSVKNSLYYHMQRATIPKEGTKEYQLLLLAKLFCFDGTLFDPELFSQEEKVKQMYLDHIEEVKKNIPANQLLVVQLGEGWERICKFLGKDVPNVPYPKSNSTAEFLDYFSEQNRPDDIIPLLA